MLTLEILAGRFALVRLPPDAGVPDWAARATRFLSFSRTPDELSILADAEVVPPGRAARTDYCALRVAGTLPLDAVGIMAGLSGALATAGVSVFPLATHDTDYLFVAEADLAAARMALERAGYAIL